MLSASALNQIIGQRIPVWNDNKFKINAQPRHHDHDLFVSYLQFTSQHRSQAQQSQKQFFSLKWRIFPFRNAAVCRLKHHCVTCD